MILSLDTSELVHVLRAKSRNDRVPFDTAVISELTLIAAAPVVHELCAGASSSARPARRLEQVHELLASLKTAAFTASDAEASGRLAARLRGQGRAIGDIDTLIAGQALSRGWSVVTRNVRHFGRVENLQIIDWSVGPDVLSSEQIAARVAERD